MKRSFMIAVLLGCCVFATAAQERVIDKKEFETVVYGAQGRAKWKGEKYRVTSTTLSTVDGRPATDYAGKIITEHGPSGERRTVQHSVFGGKVNPPREFIEIDGSSYSRTGDEAWTRKQDLAPANSSGPATTPRPKVLSSQDEHKYLGQTEHRRGTTRVYVRNQLQTLLDGATGETTKRESKHTYWLDERGAIVKTEFVFVTRGKITTRTGTTMEWELDPTISIKAPAIAP